MPAGRQVGDPYMASAILQPLPDFEAHRRGRLLGDPPAPGFHRTRRGGSKLPATLSFSKHSVNRTRPVGVANLATRAAQPHRLPRKGVAERSEAFKIMIATGSEAFGL